MVSQLSEESFVRQQWVEGGGALRFLEQRVVRWRSQQGPIDLALVPRFAARVLGPSTQLVLLASGYEIIVRDFVLQLGFMLHEYPHPCALILVRPDTFEAGSAVMNLVSEKTGLPALLAWAAAHEAAVEERRFARARR